MASEVIGRCQRCGKPLTHMPALGLVTVSHSPDHVHYSAHCPGHPDGHLLRMNRIYAEQITAGIIEAADVTLFGRDEDKAEEYWRARNRAIADAHQRELAEHRGHQAVMGQWHEGICTGCGMEDILIGVPGSDLCRYCEELRVLKPPPDAAVHQVTPVPPTVREPRPRLLAASLLLAVVGTMLIFASAPAPLCAALLAAAFIMGKAA